MHRMVVQTSLLSPKVLDCRPSTAPARVKDEKQRNNPITRSAIRSISKTFFLHRTFIFLSFVFIPEIIFVVVWQIKVIKNYYLASFVFLPADSQLLFNFLCPSLSTSFCLSVCLSFSLYASSPDLSSACFVYASL